MIYVGVDPGLSGAIAFLTGDGRLAIVRAPLQERNGKREIDPRQLAHAVRDQLHTLGPTSPVEAAIERVHAMPKQGVTSAFTFGRTLGVVEGVLAALSIPVTFVTPVAWKRALAVPADKAGARLRASETFPAHAPMFARPADDGPAEAALIAAWCRHASQVVQAMEQR
jgi:Holliday junction resolvasome RuvABC endonuclease subunit